jgi:hypothetical protein
MVAATYGDQHGIPHVVRAGPGYRFGRTTYRAPLVVLMIPGPVIERVAAMMTTLRQSRDPA